MKALELYDAYDRRKKPMIRLESERFSCYRVINVDTGEDILIQTDLDFPGIASSFGWVACECGFTDGTVDCEHRTASEMINEAREYLDDHEGDEVEDPGYFGED